MGQWSAIYQKSKQRPDAGYSEPYAGLRHLPAPTQGPFLPLSHIKVARAQRDTSTPPPLPRASCLPVWVMNVYFTYRLSVCGLNGCHISNPSKIRTMCCHCNLKLPRGFFFSFFLVWFGFSFSFHAALVLSYSKNA